MSSSSKQKENKWVSYGYRIILNTASHPFEYAKLLIQIGYEPIPPRPVTSFFGKPGFKLKLPNIFQYVKHIKTVDGLAGCYKGLTPKLCGNLVSAIAVQKLSEYMEFENEDDHNEENETPPVDNKTKCIRSVKKDLVVDVTAIIVSQPFHVIAVRMMAQFVGKETKYEGLFGSIAEIYRQNGVLGFFAGLVPRLLGDVMAILLANSLSYLVNSYLIEDKELQVYTTATMSYVANAITYPFQLVSKCMAVNDSGLKAGAPLLMPPYLSWTDCWADLSARGQLQRGSGLFFRYYTAPPLRALGAPPGLEAMK